MYSNAMAKHGVCVVSVFDGLEALRSDELRHGKGTHSQGAEEKQGRADFSGGQEW